jgi:hypothetical protein
VAAEQLADQRLAIDGFNCLITIESALSGGVVLKGRDGAYRDLASVHGSYRRVEETAPAVLELGARLSELRPSAVIWHLDRPVSNSGRLRRLLEEAAASHDWPWEVVLSADPDRLLIGEKAVLASSDSWVLDRSQRWIDLPGLVVELGPVRETAWIVDLSGDSGIVSG